jgi:hypothetical protein
MYRWLISKSLRHPDAWRFHEPEGSGVNHQRPDLPRKICLGLLVQARPSQRRQSITNRARSRKSVYRRCTLLDFISRSNSSLRAL